MQIVLAHPSWPWQDEAISLAMHKPNVWIDLSGWSPKYFPPQLVQYANTLLKDRILFGSDFPLITPDRWLKDFEEAGFKDDVKPWLGRRAAFVASAFAPGGVKKISHDGFEKIAPSRVDPSLIVSLHQRPLSAYSTTVASVITAQCPPVEAEGLVHDMERESCISREGVTAMARKRVTCPSGRGVYP